MKPSFRTTGIILVAILFVAIGFITLLAKSSGTNHAPVAKGPAAYSSSANRSDQDTG